jgi:hypothetical protein
MLPWANTGQRRMRGAQLPRRALASTRQVSTHTRQQQTASRKRAVVNATPVMTIYRTEGVARSRSHRPRALVIATRTDDLQYALQLGINRLRPAGLQRVLIELAYGRSATAQHAIEAGQ